MYPIAIRFAAAACAAVVLWTPCVAQSATFPHPPTPATAAQPQSRRLVSDEVSAAAAAAATPVAGTLVAKFTIKLVTAVPSGSEVLCGLTATVTDENTTTYAIANEIYENASTKATVSGTTATCTVIIPYSWYLTNGSTDTADLSYTLSIVSPTATNDSGQNRYSNQYVPGAGAISIPANGATTTYTISATL